VIALCTDRVARNKVAKCTEVSTVSLFNVVELTVSGLGNTPGNRNYFFGSVKLATTTAFIENFGWSGLVGFNYRGI